MKVSEAIRILNMFSPETQVELIFPDAQPVELKPKRPQLTEGEMAMLPMYPKKPVGSIRREGEMSWVGTSMEQSLASR